MDDSDGFFNPITITLFSVTGVISMFMCFEKCAERWRSSSRKRRESAVEEDVTSPTTHTAIEMKGVASQHPTTTPLPRPTIRASVVDNPILSMHVSTSHSMRNIVSPSPTKQGFGSFKSRHDLLQYYNVPKKKT